MCTAVHWTSIKREEKEGVKRATRRDCRERKDGRIIYSNNMATAIDDRQELLEQFQAVSPFAFVLFTDHRISNNRLVRHPLLWFSRWCCTYYNVYPGSLSIAGFISMLSWKPTLVGTTPGVAALYSVYPFFTPSLREISNVYIALTIVSIYKYMCGNREWLVWSKFRNTSTAGQILYFLHTAPVWCRLFLLCK